LACNMDQLIMHFHTNPRLHGFNRAYIDCALAACGGNVSSTARTLGVSRGLIDRHLRGRR